MTSRTKALGLTKRYSGGPPLSQVGGVKLGQSSVQKEVKIGSQITEPGTDDEPLSSSEDETPISNEADAEEEKDYAEEIRTEGATKRKRNGRNDLQSNTTNAGSKNKFKIHTSKESSPLFSDFGIRAPQKKSMGQRKIQKYGSSQEEFKQSPAKDLKRKRKSPAPFRQPINVNILSPPKIRKAQSIDADIHAKETLPKFRMPAVEGENSFDNLVSSVSEFREPPDQSTQSVPSSALASRDLEFDIDDDTSSLSSPPSDLSLSLAELDCYNNECDDDDAQSIPQVEVPGTDTAKPPLCPNCYAPVDPDLLGEFLSLPGRRLKDDRSFCAKHKVYKAKKEWVDNMYPVIDWDTFDERLKGFSSELERMLVPSPSTFFRGRFESAMKDGQARVFKLSLEDDNMGNWSCGYYGPKGAGRMLNYLTSKYSPKLRQLAASDNILKNAGPTVYAQAVLVPELTVLLIKEDMKVDSERARQILKESTDIGNRLNGAEDDQIHFDGEEDEYDNSYA